MTPSSSWLQNGKFIQSIVGPLIVACIIGGFIIAMTIRSLESVVTEQGKSIAQQRLDHNELHDKYNSMKVDVENLKARLSWEEQRRGK